MRVASLRSLAPFGAAVASLSVLALSLGACSSHADATGTADDALSAARVPSPLASSDFTGALDYATLRATTPDVSDAAFAIKWSAALDSSFAFFGAFAPAYHQDLGTIAASRVPGLQTVCAGDPHPDNFGWLDEGSTFFALNDFDDSGYCPVAFDALRFLAGTELDFDDDSLTADALASYVASVASGQPDTVVDGSLAPSWKSVRDTTLAADVKGSSFLLGTTTKLTALDDATAGQVRAWFAQETRLPGASLLDLASYDHDSGGSAGLPRIWLLLEYGSKLDILELKTEVEPAVEWGRHTSVLEGAARMATIEGTFWPVIPQDDSFLVSLDGSTWIARSRLARADSEIDSLGKSDRKNELLAAASQLGVAHSFAWAGVSSKKLTSWLAPSADAVAARWKDAWKAAKSAGGN